MKTAVEYFEFELKDKLGKIVINQNWKLLEDIIEQAKEMDKQQKEDFFNAGLRYGSGSVMATEWGEDTEEYNFEQYYNETFKSE
jgi:hypothetical protein